jgi:hypothetical protein
MGFRIFGGVKTRKPSGVSVRSQSNASGGGSVEVRGNRRTSHPRLHPDEQHPPRARISFLASEVATGPACPE